ncbi:MAG: pectate lyase [Verrucomicrobiota bacterium]|nr:pectate lyase [Verrucomicrobiota bacterium]
MRLDISIESLSSSQQMLLLGLSICFGPLLASVGAISWRDCANQEKDWYKTPEAIRIGDNVLYFQSDLGGWYKNDGSIHASGNAAIDVHSQEDKRKYKKSLEQRKYPCTLDNDATWSEMRFLAKVHAATGKQKYREGFLKGVQYLLEAQYPSGGWPQFYPLRPGYSSRITFNDGAMIGAIAILDNVVQRRAPYDLADNKLREKCKAAVAKGRDCILKCQIIVKGKKTVWCQQHDQRTLEPAQGRISENPSLSGAESVGVVRYLMSIDSPSPKIISAIEGAVRWFKEVKINGVRVLNFENKSLPGGMDRKVISDPKAPPIWARYYEIGTDRPMFIEDGIVKYKLSELSHTKRIGHLWIGGRWPENLLKVEYPAWVEKHQAKD